METGLHRRQHDGQGPRGRGKLYSFVLTLGYSRMRYVEFTLDMTTPTLIQCHLNAFRHLGGYPRKLLYDWQSQVARSKDDKLVWNPMFEDFAKHYGFLPKLCCCVFPAANDDRPCPERLGGCA